MKEHSLPRVCVIVLCAAAYVAVIVVNALAGAGRGPFHSSTGNVSARHETDITPAGWTFSIWGVIYTWLTLMVLYISSYVCRGSWAQSLLPYAFYVCWLSSLLLNMIWLLLWDRELMLSALVVLIMIVFSNYSTLFFCCYATDYYGLWMRTYHHKDLACLRALVQNGLALYATWTSIASLINFSLVLQLWGVGRSTAATASLCPVWRGDGVVLPGELAAGPLGASHHDSVSRGDRCSGGKHHEAFSPGRSHRQLHVHGGSAGVGLRPAGVQTLHRHLEEPQAASGLPRLSTVDGVAP